MSKPPLLFLHGFRGNHLGLAEVAAAFPDYTVHSPDLAPAGGKSFKTYDADAYTAAVAEYIKKNKLKNPVLIGHSLGSIIAAATVKEYPELVGEKLVLLAPISKKPAKFFAMLTPLTVFLPRCLVDYITTRYLFIPKDRALFKKSLETTHACSADFSSKKDVFKAGQFSAAHSIRDFLTAPKKTENRKSPKIALVVGEKDRLISLKQTRSLAKTLGAELKIVRDSGHLLNYEKPGETAAAIRDFLESKK